MTTMTTRRSFLTGTAGLVIGLTLPFRGLRARGSGAPTPVTPNAFVHIAPDDTVTVLIKHIEFGQGPNTGLATLVAEELDADWAQMRAESAPADAKLYGNAAFGGAQGTGGSTAMASSYMIMRRAGAAAREMLVAAAAKDWGVPPGEITIRSGRIAHEASGKSSGFGAFADAAASLPVPETPALKDPVDFTLIGTDLPKLDTEAKSTGRAEYTMDIYRDGMLTVVVAHPDKLGATVAGFDDTEALKVPGVQMVRQIPTGVAVYATGTYPALKGRAALSVTWDASAAETRSSAQTMEDIAAAAESGGRIVEESGDTGVIAEAETIHEAEFRFPYLAHAPMEPLDAVIEVAGGAAEMWYGSQFPSFDKPAVAGALGLKPEKVKINVMLAGGSFGRRATGDSGFALEAAQIAKAVGRDGAFKLVWTREDDLHGGYYRPMTVHRLRAGLDGEGNIVGWENVVANQSIMSGTPMEGMMKDGLDPTSYEGSNDLPYEIGARKISWAQVEGKAPVLWWRSVGHTHTAYATEMFLDELLEKAGKDPVQGRLDLLKPEATRERGVIEAVAKLADWPNVRQDGKGYGVAMAKSFGTYVAEIAEVEDRDGAPHVTRVWCAVDCGVAVNPNVIRAQMEGGIGFGLGAVMFNKIDMGQGGTILDSNFDTYRMLRISEMPKVEVAIVESSVDPTGVGEPGVPPAGPALANAWRDLTGRSVYALPFVQPPTA